LKVNDSGAVVVEKPADKYLPLIRKVYVLTATGAVRYGSGTALEELKEPRR
jgi:hypothetical protein